MLDKIKPWYTLTEVAERFARNTGDPFRASDVVQFVNDGHLAVWIDARDRYAVQVARVTTYYPVLEENPAFALLGRTVEEALSAIPEAEKPSAVAEWRRGVETLEILSPQVEILVGVHQIYMDERDDLIVLASDDPQRAKTRFIHGVLVYDNGSDQSTEAAHSCFGSLLQLVRRRVGCEPHKFPAVEDFEPDDEMPDWDRLLVSNAEVNRFERWYLTDDLASPSTQPTESVKKSRIDHVERDTRIRELADQMVEGGALRHTASIANVSKQIAKNSEKDPANNGYNGRPITISTAERALKSRTKTGASAWIAPIAPTKKRAG